MRASTPSLVAIGAVAFGLTVLAGQAPAPPAEPATQGRGRGAPPVPAEPAEPAAPFHPTQWRRESAAVTRCWPPT